MVPEINEIHIELNHTLKLGGIFLLTCMKMVCCYAPKWGHVFFFYVQLLWLRFSSCVWQHPENPLDFSSINLLPAPWADFTEFTVRFWFSLVSTQVISSTPAAVVVRLWTRSPVFLRPCWNQTWYYEAHMANSLAKWPIFTSNSHKQQSFVFVFWSPPSPEGNCRLRRSLLNGAHVQVDV